ncbi:hypothetical protein TWF506_008112 [Arthrobotrys conoides]|uniref:Uncharacterized protein n=1 Tax=Arthrobotrys conoides TaxID=74498 RepID=A0AAN8NCP3_9PEZI
MNKDECGQWLWTARTFAIDGILQECIRYATGYIYKTLDDVDEYEIDGCKLNPMLSKISKDIWARREELLTTLMKNTESETMSLEKAAVGERTVCREDEVSGVECDTFHLGILSQIKAKLKSLDNELHLLSLSEVCNRLSR